LVSVENPEYLRYLSTSIIYENIGRVTELVLANKNYHP
jgi:hypothetical protein